MVCIHNSNSCISNELQTIRLIVRFEGGVYFTYAKRVINIGIKTIIL